ncbi:MAG: hypothetical protein K1X89_18520 [Myxococcaceae bacterium]|nr:hypothetical protein [Myxococcaceae bacterium]
MNGSRLLVAAIVALGCSACSGSGEGAPGGGSASSGGGSASSGGGSASSGGGSASSGGGSASSGGGSASSGGGSASSGGGSASSGGGSASSGGGSASSGGGAGGGGPSDGGTTTCWPYDRPSTAALRASPRKVFAHYFSPYPISLDNQPPANDYYVKGYLNPAGESGAHQYCGGFLRERPVPQTPWAAGTDYELENMKIEVRRAIAIGLDGFTYDVLNPTSGVHRTRLDKLLQAAHAVDPGFVILLVPDMTAGPFNAGVSDSAALQALQTLVQGPGAQPASYHLADGRLVLSPFAANVRSAAFWSNAMSTLAGQGTPLALVPMPVGSFNFASYSGVTLYGASTWGPRTVSGAAAMQAPIAPVHDAGLRWMAPVSPQDSRPKDLVYTECDNSAAFRGLWMAAINGGADWVQLITWNDYSEDTEIAPSSRTQTAFYDLSGYYTTWFKQGAQPPIVRDALYAFHRTHSMNPAVATPDLAKQDGGLFKPVNGPSMPTNDIELVGLLTAPGTLEISVGGSTQTRVVDGGLQTFRVPLAEGTPVFRLVRDGGTVVQLSGAAIDNAIVYQDPLYVGAAAPTCAVVR